MAKINEADYLVISACAAEAGVTTQAVRKWAREGRFDTIRFGVNATLVRRSSWERFLSDRKKKAEARADRNAKPKRWQ